MRIVSRTARSVREQKREKSMRKREAAGTLANAFPRSEQIRIHLQFVSTEGPAPAARTHALYPSAQAYFDFACPHGDCDGANVRLALTRQEIADYLGLTIETVSRAFSELRRRGVLATDKPEEVRINDVCRVCRLTGAH